MANCNTCISFNYIYLPKDDDTATTQSTDKETNEWDTQGWGDDDNDDDDNNWDSIATPAPTSRPAPSFSSSSTSKSKSSALKLGGTKKTQDVDFSDWGFGEDPSEKKLSLTTSKLSKSRSGSEKSTPKGSPKKEKSAATRTDADIGGWDDGGDWGSMDAPMDDGGGGGWGDDDDWGAMEDLSMSPSKPAKVGTLLLICNGSTLKFRYCVSFYNTCVFLTRVVILICIVFFSPSFIVS